MKRLIFIAEEKMVPLLLLCLILSGCSTGQKAPAASSVDPTHGAGASTAAIGDDEAAPASSSASPASNEKIVVVRESCCQGTDSVLTLYDYDEFGREIRKATYSNGLLTEMYETSYDDHGYIAQDISWDAFVNGVSVTLTEYTFEGQTPVSRRQTFKEYDYDGTLTYEGEEILYLDADDRGNILAVKSEDGFVILAYEYDEKDRCISTERHRASGETFSKAQEYTPNGLTARSWQSNVYGDGMVVENRQEYEFNEKGYAISYKSFRGDELVGTYEVESMSLTDYFAKKSEHEESPSMAGTWLLIPGINPRTDALAEININADGSIEYYELKVSIGVSITPDNKTSAHHREENFVLRDDATVQIDGNRLTVEINGNYMSGAYTVEDDLLFFMIDRCRSSDGVWKIDASFRPPAG